MRSLASRYKMGCVTGLALLLAGCAGPQRVVNVTESPGPKVSVDMTARSFAFDPDVIVARKGDTLVLHVTNVSGEEHNLTVKDPSGKIVMSEDLPSHQTVTVEVPLETAGVYPFYCDIDLHAVLGMKGKIEVR